MRTLKRSLIETCGPETALFRGGLDSRRTAWAAAGATLKKTATATSRRNARRLRRAGCMTFLFASGGLVLLALRALFFFHLALLDALHFFLSFLECRGH